jgi:hypothetical protein
MSTLRLTYSDVKTRIADYLGIQGTLSGSDLIKVQNLVKRGYRRFLIPIDSSNQKMYQWKFLEKTTTFSTEANVDTYDLAIGFSSFVTTFTYISPLAFNPTQVDLQYILELKSTHTGTGYPRHFALLNGDYDEINGQKYKVMFWPTPSSTLNFYYTYVFTPPMLVNDKDVFVGDDYASDVILECCLAVAEYEKYDSPNTQNPQVHARESERLLQALIGKDKRDRLVPYLGQMTDGKGMKFNYTSTVLDQSGTQILP